MKWQDLLDVLRGFVHRAGVALACVAVCGRSHLVVDFTLGDANSTVEDTKLKIDTNLCNKLPVVNQ